MATIEQYASGKAAKAVPSATGFSKWGKFMANEQMIAPCGVECSHCIHYLANTNSAARKQVSVWSETLYIPIETISCNGCRAHDGQIPLQLHLFGDSHQCSIYDCAQSKKVKYCGFCDHFPCDHRHPYNEKSGLLDQNAKALLCL